MDANERDVIRRHVIQDGVEIQVVSCCTLGLVPAWVRPSAEVTVMRLIVGVEHNDLLVVRAPSTVLGGRIPKELGNALVQHTGVVLR